MGSLPPSQFGVVAAWLVLARFGGLGLGTSEAYEFPTKSRLSLSVSGGYGIRPEDRGVG